MSGEADGTGGIPHEVSAATTTQSALDAVVRARGAFEKIEASGWPAKPRPSSGGPC